MNITLTAPPNLTGDAQLDVSALKDWCDSFYLQLKRILYSLDTSNITELNASVLNGTIPLSSVSLSGTNVYLGNNYFSIATPDGAQYLKLENGALTFKGTVIE